MSLLNTDQIKFAVNYSKISPDEFQNDLDVLILESNHYNANEVKKLKKKARCLVGYISLTEINENDAYFEEIKPYLLGKNDNWDSYFIDLESKKVHDILMRKINEIQLKGFDGLLLDNLDNASIWGKHPNLKPALLNFLVELKTSKPDLMLIQNSGFEFIDDTKEVIDLLLIESIATSYDFNEQEYEFTETHDFELRKQQLIDIKKDTGIPILIVEYAGNQRSRDMVLARWQDAEFPIFVANIELNQICQ